MDDMTPEERHRNMQHIRSKDTKPELVLRKRLWHAGFRYRKNVKNLPGKPDIVILKYHICIFVDGRILSRQRLEYRKEGESFGWE